MRPPCSVAQAQTPPTTPTVSTVAVTSNPGADNTYATGDKIEVTLTFSEAVTASTTDGTPRLSIDIGGQPRNIPYERAGSNTAELIFGYTVFAGDMDADGIGVEANGLALNGGTIRSTDDSTDANLDHSAQAFANHKVDTEVVLVSNIGQTDASDTLTISATENAQATVRVPLTNNGYDLTGIVLDVKTASDTLEVTINVSVILRMLGDLEAVARIVDHTFTGSVSSVGRQVFALQYPDDVRANLSLGSGGTSRTHFDVAMTISGMGDGSVELGATTSSAEDTGGQGGFSIHDPATGSTIPRFSLVGHTAAVPYIYHTEIVSKPADGTSYKAGEYIDVLIVPSRILSNSDESREIELWFGNGAENRRNAQLVSATAITSLGGLLFSYEVQPGDTDSDGILLGVNALGHNPNFDLVDIYSNVPAELSMSALQHGTEQSVQGSQARTCQEILCATAIVERDPNPDNQYLQDEYLFGYYVLSSLVYGVRSYRPMEYYGSLSGRTFGYGGKQYAIVTISDFENVNNPAAGILRLTVRPRLPQQAIDRLAFSVNNTVFVINEALNLT